MSCFNDLRDDEGYAAEIEVAPEQMISSHSVKRFFRKFTPSLLQIQKPFAKAVDLAIQLNREKPSVIILGVMLSPVKFTTESGANFPP